MNRKDNLQLKRVYDLAFPTDGKRILVDRLWPRGLRKETAQIDEWLKDVAPSADLRQWFSHQPERFEVFQELYRRELLEETRQSSCQKIVDWADEGPVTLLFAARDRVHNHAQVLLQKLLES